MQAARAVRAGNDAVKAGVFCLSDEVIFLVREVYDRAYIWVCILATT